MSGVWFWLPTGPVRISTVLGALIVWGVITWVRREPFTGYVVQTAWVSLFETIYHVVGIVGYHWPFANFFWATGAVAGWVILAAVLGIWPDWRISLLFALLMGIWIATGFHYNVAGQTTPINIRDEILNEAAKSTLGLAYLVGALRRSHQEELVEPLVDRDRRSGIGRRLQLARVNAWLDRTFAHRVVPGRAVASYGARENGRAGVVEPHN